LSDVKSSHLPPAILAICVALHIVASGARVHAQASPIVQVEFANLMASQFNVGYQGVNNFTLPPFELLYTTGWYDGDTSNPNNW